MTYSPLELAAACVQAGELEDALAALNQHLDDNTQDDRARRMRINVLRHLDKWDTALADFELLTDHIPDDMFNQSVLLQNAGDSDAATALLDGACERWPDHERLAERYVQLLIEVGRSETALAVIRKQPRNWHWLGWEGDLLVQMGDDMTATARYGLALAQLGESPDRWLEPIRARLLLARAHAYRRLEFFEQAEENYRAAERIVPGDPMIPFLRGLLCFLEGDLEAAIALCIPAFSSASDALCDQMRQELHGNEIYAALRAAIETQMS